MRLNPAATNASSNLKDVRSSAVHPKTFPPKASGATSRPELPTLRFFIPCAIAIRRIASIKTPANFALDVFS